MHQAGQGEPAVQAASQALAYIAPVSNAEPNSAEAQQDLANAYFHLGAAENIAGKFQDAINHLRTAESRLRPPRQIPANDPLGTVKLFVDIQREMASALLETHHPASAVEALEKAVAAAQGHTATADWLLADLRRQLERARGAAQTASGRQR
jgi:tetratricopeptide (TPR) repeat protein